MGDASNLQTSFLGGAITPAYQGRADTKKYAEGLNVCLNSMPLETGAWTRRPGTRVAALTRNGVAARVIDFNFSQSVPFTVELTDGHMRLFNGTELIHTNDIGTVASISTANPAVVTLNSAVVWSANDQVDFLIDNPTSPASGSLLQNRQFQVQSPSGSTFTLFDPLTGSGIDGSTLGFVAGTPTQVARVLDLATNYSASMLQQIRAVQALNGNTNLLLLLHRLVAPYALTSTGPSLGACLGETAFSLNTATFVDGPYLDVPTDGSTITPSAVSGSVTLTASANIFASTDVGRHVRLLSQPAAWASDTAYTAGQTVTYNNAYYVALVNNTGNIPGADTINWAVSTNVAQWGWAIITAFTDAKHVTATLQTPLVNANATSFYRLGTYSATTGYPAVGCYHEGRLWLAGYAANRIDGSSVGQPGGIFNFSPTAADGSVADSNAISYTFNFQNINPILWMVPQQTGILCGTQAGEILVQASSNSDVLTPTSIQAKRVTKYGSANVEPVDAPFATLIVERNNRKMLEYLADVFTGKYTGINISLTGSKFIKSGIQEIKYQKELAPIAWVRNADGTLAGMTYRRESPMLSEQPAFSGWHSHALGNGRSVESISVGPSVNGDLDSLTMVTLDPNDNLYRVEVLTDLFPEDGIGTDAWFVDGGIAPSNISVTANLVTLYGLHQLEGKTVSVWMAGTDVGDFTVASGQIAISLPAGYNGSNLLTFAALQTAFSSSQEGIAQPAVLPVPNFPSASLSLQAYIGPSSPVSGITDDNVLIDVARRKLIVFSDGHISTSGIRQFDLDSGAQTNTLAHDIIFGGSTNGFNSPYGITADGHIIFPNATSNSVSYYDIDPDVFLPVSFAGANGSQTSPDATHIQLANNLASMSGCGMEVILAPSALAASPVLNVMIANSGGALAIMGYSFTLSEGGGLSCGSDAFGVGYTLAKTSGITTTPLGLYKTGIIAPGLPFNVYNFPTQQAASVSTSKSGTISAAQIDATWTHISGISSPCIDHTDGHVMFFASTTDSVTNSKYLVKVNSNTAAVLWATAVLNFPSEMTVNMANSFIAYGKYQFLLASGGSCNLYTINTISGALTSVSVPGITITNASIYDARLGSVFWSGSFSAGGGSPALLNSTPSSWSDQWAQLYTSAGSIGLQTGFLPVAVGTTFTSQAQRLRALDPAQSGARNGPALAKNRRTHRMGLLLNSTAGIAIGTTFNKMRPAKLTTQPGNAKALADNVLFSGVFSGTPDDNDTYDSMSCWQIVRPYPGTVLAAGAFLNTEDR